MGYPNLLALCNDIIEYLRGVRVVSTQSVIDNTLAKNPPEPDLQYNGEIVAFCLSKMRDLKYVGKLKDDAGNDFWYLNQPIRLQMENMNHVDNVPTALFDDVLKYLNSVRVATTLSVHAGTLKKTNPPDNIHWGFTYVAYTLNVLYQSGKVGKLKDSNRNDCWYLIQPIAHEHREVDCPNCGRSFTLDK